jgi:hypothetical protein
MLKLYTYELRVVLAMYGTRVHVSHNIALYDTSSKGRRVDSVVVVDGKVKEATGDTTGVGWQGRCRQ